MAARLEYMKLAPEGFRALGALGHAVNTAAGLEPVLLDLVRLLASEMNGCEYCIELHSAELKKLHEPEGRIADVLEWRGSDAYTQRERAAFAWTEAVTNIQDGHARGCGVCAGAGALQRGGDGESYAGDYYDQCVEPDCDCAGGFSGAWGVTAHQAAEAPLLADRETQAEAMEIWMQAAAVDERGR